MKRIVASLARRLQLVRLVVSASSGPLVSQQLALGGAGLLLALATGALASWATGCEATSPPPLVCDTAAESRTYFLTSGCGTGGFITVSSATGSCAVSVDGGYVAQVPSSGDFTAPGADGRFTLEAGHWVLEGSVRYGFHPPVDEMVDCTAGTYDPDAGTQPITCAAQVCSDIGDEGSTCEDELCEAVLYDPDRLPVPVVPVDGGSASGDPAGDDDGG